MLKPPQSKADDSDVTTIVAPELAVPFNDVGRCTQDLAGPIDEAVRSVIRSGWYVLGPSLDRFEREFADACGATHAIGVASGTDALELALRAAGVQRGDEVLMVANAGMYGAAATLAIGAFPRFLDIDPKTNLVDPRCVRGAVSERTRAFIATHLYGRPVDIGMLRSSLPGVAIVEDCAQAHGASVRGGIVGSLGDVSAFSFYPTKNLGALGDAGAVVTDSDVIANRVRSLRQYGWTAKYSATVPGGRNSRLDEMQAAILSVKLPHLELWNERRRSIADRFRNEIVHPLVALPSAAELGAKEVAHLFVVRSPKREDLASHLKTAGIGTAVHYPVPDYRQPALVAALEASGQALPGPLAETEQACAEVLSLPCFPELSDDEVSRIVSAVNAWPA